MWLMVPMTTPPLSEERFTCQGRSVAWSMKTRPTRRARTWPNGLVHLSKPKAEIEPAPAPGSPLPRLSVPLALNDPHLNASVLVSLTVAVPDLAAMAPPGRMVQVAAAWADVIPRVAARTAAVPAARMRA